MATSFCFCAALSTVLVLGYGCDAPSSTPEAAKADPGGRARKPRVKITISRQTTYITKPLRPDGYPDYVAALNEHYSQGVTPENNAAVLLMQAFGPNEINPAVRERFFKMLGMPVLPQESPYLVSLHDYVKRKDTKPDVRPGPEGKTLTEMVEDQRRQAMERPWSKDEFPILGEWLEQNRKPLELVAEAAQRPRYYMPLIASNDQEPLLSVLFPTLDRAREGARALRCRAMLRLKAGQVEAAWRDLQTCRRLARLVSQGPVLVDCLVAVAIDEIAAYGEVALVQQGNLTVEQIKRFAQERNTLPPFAPVAERIDRAERYVYLDTVAGMVRAGPGGFRAIGNGGRRDQRDESADYSLENLLWHVVVDWDEALRMGNQYYDRFAIAFAKAPGSQRRAALDALDRDVREEARLAKDIKQLALCIFSPARAGRQIGRILVGLVTPVFRAVIPPDDRRLTSNGMVDVVYALAAYRAEQGSYPDKLAQLCPKYLKAIPEDLMGSGPVRYRRERDGYVLYSVGLNGKDDGGHNYHEEVDPNAPPEKRDCSISTDADDIVIRFPPRASRK